jgi:DnaJ domain
MATGMGGERRTWVRSHAAGPRITSNSDALQAENYLLRQEVLRLRQQLDRRESRPPAAEAWSRRSPVTSGGAPAPAITADHVRRWGEAMTRHRRWHQLRVGASAWHSPHGRSSSPGRGLKGLIDQLLAGPADTAATFEHQLERRWPGLTEDLRGALQGPSSKARLAVRAAFAMLGPAAAARLDLEPLAVVELLMAATSALEVEADAAQTQRSWTQPPPRQQAPQDRSQDRSQDPWSQDHNRRTASGGASRGASQGSRPGPTAAVGADRADGTRRRTTGARQERPGTETSGAGPTGAGAAGQPGAGSTQADPGQAKSTAGSRRTTNTPPPSGSAGDRRQLAALETLGLAWGASRAAIKAAHRRLVKQHHPDMGGDAESFRLVNDAYQLLIA